MSSHRTTATTTTTTRLSPAHADHDDDDSSALLSLLSTSPDSSASDSITTTTATTSSSPSSSPPYWHNFAAGGAAGAGSRIVTAPLDLIRIRRQLSQETVTYPSESMWRTWQKIIQTEKGGVLALFRGNTAAILLWVSYSAVQFAVYTPSRNWFQTHPSIPGGAFWSGAAAGVCATLATYPFDVCRTTFAARGVTTTTTTTTGAAVEPAAAMAAAAAASNPPPPPPAAMHSLVEPSFPQSQNRALQQPSFSSSSAPRTLLQFVVQLYKARGIRGFYAGAGPASAQIIPYMGLNFWLYDTLSCPPSIPVTVSSSSSPSSSQSSQTSSSQSQPQGLSASTAGAIAGAVSKLAIYPVDTIKRRLQAQAFFEQRVTAATTTTSIGVSQPQQARAQPQHRVWQTVTEIYTQGGWRSFYRGVFPSLLKTTIASSLSFSLYKWTKEILAGAT